MRNLQITQQITNRESRSSEAYFNEFGKVALVTAEEEVILAQKIRQGDQKALERLTKANLRFVVSVAKKYQNFGLPLSDLISEGNLGLIKAAHRFDETKGFKFISFAVWWIRQSIMFAIAEHARIMRLPMNKINEITKINQAVEIVEQQTQREPTIEQLADHLDMDRKKVREALSVAPKTSSLDLPLGVEDQFSILDSLRNSEPETDHSVILESVKQDFENLLSTLSTTEQQIIELTFGFSEGNAK